MNAEIVITAIITFIASPVLAQWYVRRKQNGTVQKAIDSATANIVQQSELLLNTMKDELQTAKEQITNLKKELKEVKERGEAIQRELEQTRAERDKLGREVHRLRDIISQMQKDNTVKKKTGRGTKRTKK